MIPFNELEPLLNKDYLGKGGQGIVHGCIWNGKSSAVKEIVVAEDLETTKNIF